MCVVTIQMVGDRWRLPPLPPRVTILGASCSATSANHPVSVPPTGPELPDASSTDRVIIVLGLRFALPEALRRHFLRAVAAAVFYVHVAAATSASCRGISQQNIAFHMFLMNHVPCPVRDAAATWFVCSRGADDGITLYEAHFRSPFLRSTRSSWDPVNSEDARHQQVHRQRLHISVESSRSLGV